MMAELVEVANIPDRATRGCAYPWKAWAAQLTNGKALRLGREDVPEGSSAYLGWDNTKTRRGAFNSAKRFGLHVAIRGEFVYLWRA